MLPLPDSVDIQFKALDTVLPGDNAEKCLRSLSVMAHYNVLHKDETYSIPKQSFRLMLQKLEHRIKVEQLSLNIATLYNRVGQSTWDLVRQSCQDLLKEHCPVDVNRLIALMKAALLAQETLTNRHGIVCVGPTGAAKSSWVQFMCGSEFELDAVRKPIPVRIPPRQGLQNVRVAASAESVTDHVTVVPIPWEELGAVKPPMNHKTRKTVVLLADPPGLLDTRGVEVEISNGLSTVSALQIASSLQVVFFIHKATTGARLDHLPKHIATLVRMVNNIQQYVRSFFYVFVDFNEQDILFIKQLLAQLIEKAEQGDSSCEAYLEVLRDLQEKLEPVDGSSGCLRMESGRNVFFFNPFEPADRPMVAESLYALSKECIQDPASVLRPFVTSEAASALRQQVSAYERAIKIAVESNDFVYAKLRLDQFQKLCTHLVGDHLGLTSLYKALVESLSRIFDARFAERRSELRRKLCSEERFLDEDMMKLQTFLRNQRASEEIRLNYLGSTPVNFSGELVDAVENVVNQFNVRLDQSQVPARKNDLDKLAILQSECSEQLPTRPYQRAVVVMQKQLDQLLDRCSELIQEGHLDAADETMSLVQSAFQQLRPHLPSILEESINAYRASAVQRLSALVETTQSALVELALKNETQIQRLLRIMEEAIRLVAAKRGNLISVPQLQDIVASFHRHLRTRLEQLRESIPPMFKGPSSGRFGTAQAVFAEIELLYKVPGVREVCFKEYHDALFGLKGRLLELRTQLETLLQRLSSGDANGLCGG